MEDATPSKIHANSHSRLNITSYDKTYAFQQLTAYQALIGGLLQAAFMARHDIMFAVSLSLSYIRRSLTI
jgi:hypothetical protein